MLICGLTANSYAQERCNLDFKVQNIGEEHNKRVMELYQGVDFSNAAKAKEMVLNNANGLDFDASTLKMTRAEIIQVGLDVSAELSKYDNDIRNWKDNPIQKSDAYPYIENILKEVDNLSSLSELNKNIDAIVMEAKQKLKCQDLDLVIATAEVTKGSAYLWTPKSMNGLGYYEQTVGNSSNSNQARTAAQIIKGAIIGDASALSASFIKMGWMIAAGLEVPGANVAILVGLAIDAAIGSAMGALFG